MFRIKVAALCMCVLALGMAASLNNSVDMAGLKSDKRATREKSYDAAIQDRANTIAQLVALAKVPAGSETTTECMVDGKVAQLKWAYHEPKQLATRLLGDMRAEEAVGVLAENLEYFSPNQTTRSGDEMGPFEGPGWFPAVESLIKIGIPSVGPVVDKLGGYGQDCLGRRLCMVVLKGVLGPRLAKMRLEMAVEDATSEAARANLKAALSQSEADREVQDSRR